MNKDKPSLNSQDSDSVSRMVWIVCIILTIFGVLFRIFRITENTFVYYDEGMWLGYIREFLQSVEANPPKTISHHFKFINLLFYFALASGKALWAFIASLRIFFTGVDGWYFVRIVSAVFGILTLWLTYHFTKKFLQSKTIACMAMAILAILPSHLYYSRLGLQEMVSGFLFLLGMHLFLQRKRTWIKAVLSGFVFSLVFFSSYRLIIIPVITLLSEIYLALSEKRRFNIRFYVWHAVSFLAVVFILGGLYDGQNTRVTFGWMFHQMNLSKGHFQILNLFSFPYYLFKLESIIFALLFFANFFFLWKKRVSWAYSFVLVILFMAIFSFPQEKGVRYLCVVMPFMAIAVAQMIDEGAFKQKVHYWSKGLLLAVFVMVAVHIHKNIKIVQFKTDYRTSMQFLSQKRKTSKVISTQAQIQQLFAQKNQDVIEAPRSINHLISHYKNGYRYFVIGPQAYVSWTKNKKRFDPPLADYMNFFVNHVRPIKSYSHFHQDLLERFVLDHNEDLVRSLRFIKMNRKENYGALKIYDIQIGLAHLKSQLMNKKPNILSDE